MGLFGNSPNRKVQKAIDNLKKQGATSESYKLRKHCGSCVYFVQGNHCNYHNKRTIPAELCHSYWGVAVANYSNSGIVAGSEYTDSDLEVAESFDDYDPILREQAKIASEIKEIEECYTNLFERIRDELQNNRLPEICLQFSGYIKSLEVDAVEELLQVAFAEIKRYQSKALPRLAKKVMNEYIGSNEVSSHEIADHLEIDVESIESALTEANEITEQDAFMIISKVFSGLVAQVIDVCADWMNDAMNAEIQYYLEE